MVRANYWFLGHCDVIAAMLVVMNKGFLISWFCLYHPHSLHAFLVSVSSVLDAIHLHHSFPFSPYHLGQKATTARIVVNCD